MEKLVLNREHNYEETKNTVDICGLRTRKTDRRDGGFSHIAKTFILDQAI